MLTAVPLASKGYSALAFPLTQHSCCSYAAYPVPTSGNGLDADELSHSSSDSVKDFACGPGKLIGRTGGRAFNIRKNQPVNSQTRGPSDPTQCVQVSSVSKTTFSIYTWQKVSTISFAHRDRCSNSCLHHPDTEGLQYGLDTRRLLGNLNASFRDIPHLFHIYWVISVSYWKDSFWLVSCGSRKRLHAYANPWSPASKKGKFQLREALQWYFWGWPLVLYIIFSASQSTGPSLQDKNFYTFFKIFIKNERNEWKH